MARGFSSASQRRADETSVGKQIQRSRWSCGKRGGCALCCETRVAGETGLTADLWLCGTSIVDAGQAGICLYIFSGELPEGQGEPRPSTEGLAEWVSFDRIGELDVVEDVPIILSKIRHMQRGDPPFSALSKYDAQDKLIVEFGE